MTDGRQSRRLGLTKSFLAELGRRSDELNKIEHVVT